MSIPSYQLLHFNCCCRFVSKEMWEDEPDAVDQDAGEAG